MSVRRSALDADQAASFDAFYRSEFARLAVVATAISGDPSVGEDLAQEALTRAHRDWPRIRDYDNPRAWTRRVAVNLSLNRRRKLANEAKALLRLRAPASVDPTLLGDPEVWRAVSRLSPRQRSVVALHYIDDLPVAAIAATLGISVSTATSTLHQARSKLRESLQDTNPPQETTDAC